MVYQDRYSSQKAEPYTVPAVSKAQQAAIDAVFKIEPRLQQARLSIEKGDYQTVLTLLPSSSRELEMRNVYAVCLMRLLRFYEAVELLRPVVVHHSIAKMRDDIPLHIRINFATALYFSGRPAGGLAALQEIQADHHPAVMLVREHARHWVASMSFWKRLDWRMNGVAPKQLPGPPSQPVGLCVWDVTS